MGRGVNVVRRSAEEKFHGRLDYNLSLAAVRSRVAGFIFVLSAKVVLTPLHMLQTELIFFGHSKGYLLTAEHSSLTFRVEWMEEGVAPPSSFLP